MYAIVNRTTGEIVADDFPNRGEVFGYRRLLETSGYHGVYAILHWPTFYNMPCKEELF